MMFKLLKIIFGIILVSSPIWGVLLWIAIDNGYLVMLGIAGVTVAVLLIVVSGAILIDSAMKK